MAYFVTGATGFIGRHLVEELLRNRTGDVYVLVRESSRDRLDPLIASWPDAEPRLGVSEGEIVALRGTVDHFFHLAAIYDMTADAERNEKLNVEGTRNA